MARSRSSSGGIAGSFVGVFYPHQVGGGPIIPPEAPVEPPLGIWGPPGPWPTPPIYIPIPPDPGSPEEPPHIWVPVFPTNPIVIPQPPDKPVVWPPPGSVGDLPPGFYPGDPPPRPHPQPPPGIWGPPGPWPTPPIYIQPDPPGGGEPPQVMLPIYLPEVPAHPIELPPDSGGGPPVELPPLPPAWVAPPTGARGFWGYSVHYDSMVFVPYEGVIGPPGGEQPPTTEPPTDPNAPVVNPLDRGRRG